FRKASRAPAAQNPLPRVPARPPPRAAPRRSSPIAATKRSRARLVAQRALEEAPLVDGTIGCRCPIVAGLFSRFRPPHALAAPCGIIVRRRLLSAGRSFARSLSEDRCQGFSPLQPKHRSFVRHEPEIFGSEVANSLRPSAGGANEEAAP